MIKTVRIIAYLVFSLLSTFAFAQNSKFSLFFALGPSLPSSPSAFSDNWNSGFNINIGFEYIFNQRLSLSVVLAQNNFDINEENLIENIGLGKQLDQQGLSRKLIEVNGGTINIISLSTVLKARFFNTAKFNPYFMGEAGYWDFLVKDVTLSSVGRITIQPDRIEGEVERTFAVNFGLGLEKHVEKKVKFFLD